MFDVSLLTKLGRLAGTSQCRSSRHRPPVSATLAVGQCYLRIAHPELVVVEVPSTLCHIVMLPWVCEARAAESCEREDPEVHHRKDRVRLSDMRIGSEVIFRGKAILRSSVIL